MSMSSELPEDALSSDLNNIINGYIEDSESELVSSFYGLFLWPIVVELEELGI